MFRVLWYKKGSKSPDFEDFNDAGDAIEFATKLRATGTRCEIGEVPPYNHPRWDL